MNEIAGIDDEVDREVLFVRGLAEGRSVQDAASEAGYSKAHGYTLQKRPKIQGMLHQLLAMRLTVEAAPKAISVLVKLLDGRGVSDKIKLEAAKTLLDRAGYATSREAEKPNGNKELVELSPDQLRAQIAVIQVQLAEQAIPVNAPIVEGDSIQVIDLLD